MAVKSILGGKVRAFLTMLGVIIGVAAVISSVAFAQGSTKSVTDSLQEMGTNMLQVMIVGRNSSRDVDYDEIREFAAENNDVIDAIAPQITSSVTIKYRDKNMSTSLIGTSPDYEDVRNVHITSGRYILPYDVDYYQKVVLMGTAVVNELFDGQNPINQKVKINGQEFTVVGILEQRAGGQVSSDDDQVIIPVTVGQRLLKTSTIRNFSVHVTSSKVVDDAMNRLDEFLFSVYGDKDMYRVINQEKMISTLQKVTSSMSAILGGIAAISLIVGGIGIMNIMLVSVTERTREIGIRKAIGAKKRDILAQFLFEALMITGIGGIIGVITGLSVIKFVIGGLGIVPEAYSVTWTILSFSISLAIGVLFGLIPAYKAANLNPIEALRFE